MLVAIHELIEAVFCEASAISLEEIDQFDLHYEGKGEPGDDFHAPYYFQHQIATGVERILAAELGVSWNRYEQHCNELTSAWDPPIKP